MKVSKQDLRLGNIFEQGIVCKINGRTGAKVHVYGKLKWKKGLKVIESVAVEDLKPISLSPQVLVDWCGFKDTKHDDYDLFTVIPNPRDNKFESILGIIEWGDGIIELYIENKPTDINCGSSALIKPIKYLHELQNLYYVICGKELEIKE